MPKDYRSLSCLISLSGVVVIIIIAILGKWASAADHPLCSYFAELANLPDVEVAVWIGYPDGWQDYPKVWDYETYTELPGGTGILSRVAGDQTWLWGFRSLTENEGNHDFCSDVLIMSQDP